MRCPLEVGCELVHGRPRSRTDAAFSLSMSHKRCNVVVVGAGVAGASAAYQLAAAGVDDVVLIDCGGVGEGSSVPVAAPAHALAASHGVDGGVFDHAGRSGTGVLPRTRAIKMMITAFESDSTDFITHHGEDMARTYLQASTEGIRMQVQGPAGW